MFPTNSFPCTGRLPREIAIEILADLTPKRIAKMREVSTKWRDLVDNSILHAKITYGECLVYAKKNARLVTNRELKAKIFSEIAEWETVDNPSLTRPISNEIERSFPNPQGLVKAKGQSLDDLAKRKRDVEELLNKPIPKKKELFELAKLQASFDPIEAKKTALKIQDSDLQAQALVEIAKLQASYDFVEAKKTIEEIEGPSWRARALLELAKRQAPYQLSGAKKTIEEIEDPFWRACAFIEIGKIAKGIFNKYWGGVN
ncbi:MAG: F-box protein [Chlamydiales bacterium]|nr:F-box protein [Chlamydiales bacterium]